MSKCLGSKYESKNNAFNLLRFIFASMVISFHSYILFYGTNVITVSKFLSHLKELSWEALVDFLLVINGYFGLIAVNGFFTISGFLITHSLLHSENVIIYLIKRGLRIYPALLASLVGTVIIGLFFTKMNLWDYFFKGDNSAFSFIIQNFILLTGVQITIQDVFSDFNFINGSLWTLPYEVWCYLLLMFLHLTRIPLKIIVPLIALVTNIMFVIMNVFSIDINLGLINVEFFRLSSFFLNGAIMYLYKDYIPNNGKIAVIMALTLAISPAFKFGKYICLISLPFIVIWGAVNLKLSSFEKYGDFSYGMYIYSMPIQLVVLSLFKTNLVTYSVISFLITLAASMVSWHLVEKPALNLKKHIINLNKRQVYQKLAS